MWTGSFIGAEAYVDVLCQQLVRHLVLVDDIVVQPSACQY